MREIVFFKEYLRSECEYYFATGRSRYVEWLAYSTAAIKNPAIVHSRGQIHFHAGTRK